MARKDSRNYNMTEQQKISVEKSEDAQLSKELHINDGKISSSKSRRGRLK